MNHEEAALLLQDLCVGTLDGAEQSALEEHLAACEDCRSLATFHRILHDSLNSVTEHPRPRAIVRYALEQDATESTARKSLEEHLRSCASCADEIARVRRAEDSVLRQTDTRAAPPRTVEPFRRLPAGWLAVAAVLLLTALAYPAYLGIFKLPAVVANNTRLTESLRDPEGDATRVETWSGAVRLHLVSSPRRDATQADRPLFVIGTGDPYLVLGVEVDLPTALADSETVRVELADEGGKVTASIEMAAGDVRRAVEESGVLTWLVPVTRIHTGPWALSVRADEEDAGIFRSWFEIRMP
jgi:hypothetical protein